MLENEKIKEAVDAVLALMKAKGEAGLMDLPKKIDLQFTMKQIPKGKCKNILVELPASIHHELREVCLFVKDLDKNNREYEATVQHYENLFRRHKIDSITKIVPLKALRTDYSLPSSKVQLAKAYDLYLAESCVLGLLPGLLGKIFYAKKKTVPVKVNLYGGKLKAAIDKVVNNTRLTIKGTGSSGLVTVGHDKMKKEDIVENVKAACEHLMEKIPGGRNNVRNIYIKSADSMAVPIYVNTESANMVNIPKVKANALPQFEDEITTVNRGKVKVRADGLVKVIKDKKNIKTKPNSAEKRQKRTKSSAKESATEIKEDDNEESEKPSREDVNKKDVEIDDDDSEDDDDVDENDDDGEDDDDSEDDDEGDDDDEVDDDDKDNVQVEIKKKAGANLGKRQGKRKIEDSNDDGASVEKKKQNWTKIGVKKGLKTLKKGRVARKR